MTTIALRSATSLWRAPWKARNVDTGWPGQSHGVRFDLVTDPAAFETLEPEWDALFATAGRPSQVFQTFAWNWHWCRHYLPPASPGARTQLAIVTGRQHGRLVLVWPLVLERVAGLRRLAWMGDPVSQYGDVLVAAEADDHATFAAAWSFALTATRADFAHLRKVRDDSIAARALAHLNAKVIATEQAPYLDLSSIAGTEACQQLLASKGRRNRRRHERRLADHGPITVHSSSGEAAAQLARDAIDLKRQSLAGKGQISRAFADDRFKAFFADVAAGCDRPIPCRIATLRSGSDTAAIQITLDCKGHRFLHVTVYVCAFEKFGAGALLLEREVQKSFEDGFAVFDLLAPLHPYKMEFASTTMPVRDYAVAATLRGRLYAATALSGRQRAKRCVESLPAPLRRYFASLIAIRSALKSGATPTGRLSAHQASSAGSTTTSCTGTAASCPDTRCGVRPAPSAPLHGNPTGSA
jgi:CelD/BcsL family acetyltransferase involved in cellulose biosynthesis